MQHRRVEDEHDDAAHERSRANEISSRLRSSIRCSMQRHRAGGSRPLPSPASESHQGSSTDQMNESGGPRKRLSVRRVVDAAVGAVARRRQSRNGRLAFQSASAGLAVVGLRSWSRPGPSCGLRARCASASCSSRARGATPCRARRARCPASCAARARAAPTWRPTSGRRCGPKTRSATTRMTRISSGPTFMFRSALAAR